MPEATPLKEISGSELAAYFNAKGVRTGCTRCGHEYWTIHDSGDMRGVAIPAITDAGTFNMELAIPLLPLSCNQCATFWFVARIAVEDWLKENPTNG